MRITYYYLLVACSAFSFSGEAKAQAYDTATVEQTLKDLVSGSPIDQSDLDSISFRYSQLTSSHETIGFGRCTDIACTRARILAAGMFGGKSPSLLNLLTNDDACTPQHGLYAYMRGNIYFDLGKYEAAQEQYKTAIGSLGVQDKASVMIQLNLSAALNQNGQYKEAIDSLMVMLEPQSRWSIAPGIQDKIYHPQITINAAGMLISASRSAEALNLLTGLKSADHDDYWSIISMCNEYIANNNIKNFAVCDSIWTNGLKLIPAQALPTAIYNESLGSMLAADDIDYIWDLREKLAGKSMETGGTILGPFLLNPELSETEVIRNWALLKEKNAVERSRFEAYYNEISNQSEGPSEAASQLQALLSQEQRTKQSWQVAALIACCLLLLVFISLWVREQKKRQDLATELSSFDKQSQTMSLESNFKVSPEEIRKIHLGLTKGFQIAEALLALRKIELFHSDDATQLDAASLKSLPGVKALSKLEFEVLILTAKAVPVKEIAHQLNVSSGYLYNTRSAIRKKLSIPNDTSLNLWITQQLRRKT